MSPRPPQQGFLSDQQQQQAPGGAQLDPESVGQQGAGPLSAPGPVQPPPQQMPGMGMQQGMQQQPGVTAPPVPGQVGPQTRNQNMQQRRQFYGE